MHRSSSDTEPRKNGSATPSVALNRKNLPTKAPRTEPACARVRGRPSAVLQEHRSRLWLPGRCCGRTMCSVDHIVFILFLCFICGSTKASGSRPGCHISCCSCSPTKLILIGLQASRHGASGAGAGDGHCPRQYAGGQVSPVLAPCRCPCATLHSSLYSVPSAYMCFRADKRTHGPSRVIVACS